MKYRKVDPKIWNDRKFRSLSDNGKLVFLFLLTHPHMTALGAMRATVPGLGAELEWKEKAFREAFQEALLKGMVKADEKACFVWLPKFLRYNTPESPNVVRAWAKAADDIPECNLKEQCLQGAKALLEGYHEGYQKAFAEAFPEASRKPSPNQEQEQEQDIPPYSPPLDPNPKTPKRDFKAEAREVLAYLNDVTGKNFSDTSQIEARLKAGGTIEQCKQIIDTKRHDPHFQETPKYFNPVTLFRKKHWDVYLNERPEDFKPSRESGPGGDPWVCRNCGKQAEQIIDGLCPKCHELKEAVG
jgi:uncharacterized phage protein (TIGR02220 family)